MKKWIKIGLVVLMVTLVASLATFGCTPKEPEAVTLGLQVSMSYTPGEFITEYGLRLIETCAKYADGKLILKPYYTGDVYPTYADQCTAVMSGEADWTFAPTASYGALGIPEQQIPTSLPYTGDYNTKLSHQEQFWSSPAGTKLKGLLRDKGVVMLDIALAGPQGVFLNRKAETLEELGKVKVRVPGREADVLTAEAIGLNPVPLPYSEFAMAMKTGVVDGVVTTMTLGATERFWELGVTHFLSNVSPQTLTYSNFVSTKAWDEKLPEDTKKIILERIIPETDAWAYGFMSTYVEQNLKILHERMVCYELSPSLLKTVNDNFVAIVHPMIAELDPEMYASFREIAGF